MQVFFGVFFKICFISFICDWICNHLCFDGILFMGTLLDTCYEQDKFHQQLEKLKIYLLL